MKKHNIFYVLSLLMLSGCGVQLQSVVDPHLSTSYKRPLIVIPFESGRTVTFSNSLKRHLEDVFSQNQQEVDVLLISADRRDELALNVEDDRDKKIANAIVEGGKDLVIFFKPEQLEYYNGTLQTASYQLIGIDTGTNREVWKANYSSSGSFGPSIFARASAEKIFKQLLDDNIIKPTSAGTP
ncbi:hypothetical protein AB9P05_02325 [Roseivirga sp. BDSF3-8]|uniref:hypothetical protein n=1 Tax=Roseivirga sp. BDSF3-8 TaxID=3241598 RepID=UPI0035323AF4